MTKEERDAALEEFVTLRQKALDDEIAALLDAWLQKERPLPDLVGGEETFCVSILVRGNTADAQVIRLRKGVMLRKEP